MFDRPHVELAVIATGLALAACNFDVSGTRYFDRGQRDAPTPGAESSSPDTVAPHGPPDLFSPPDRSRDKPRPPDQRVQGTTCNDGGYSFKSNMAPSSGGSLTIEVVGPSRIWVLCGVATQANQAVSGFLWKADPTNTGGNPVTWTFTGVKVPSAPGPYLFGFVADAEDNDPGKAKLFVKCLP